MWRNDGLGHIDGSSEILSCQKSWLPVIFPRQPAASYHWPQHSQLESRDAMEEHKRTWPLDGQTIKTEIFRSRCNRTAVFRKADYETD